MKLKSLADVEKVLSPYYEVAKQTMGKDITTDRTKRLMAHIGNPEKRLRVVHVAGTSGKTSTTYYISRLLNMTGAKVGSTVSPHIEKISERVQINGVPLADDVFCGYMEDFLALIDDVSEKPSWFELIIAFALWVFDREKVDYAVLETGMGGLHDATNVCTRVDKICVITDIGIDHTRWLGSTAEQIAGQKSGIIHEGNQVLMYGQSEEVMRVVKFKVSQTEDADIFVQSQELLQKAYGGDFSKGLPEFQKRNWLLAYATMRFISNRDNLKPLTAEELVESQILGVPGRMERVKIGSKTVIFDGAHNESKMSAFVESFKAEYGDIKVPVLFALKDDKEEQAIGPLVASIASEVIVTAFGTSQDWPISAQNPAELAKYLKSQGIDTVRAIENSETALQEILNSDADIVVVVGSFYLVSELRANKSLSAPSDN